MTCRHEPGDPSCSSNRPAYGGVSPATPDASAFEVVEAEQVGPHLVVKARYPNCARCSYEGVKVMVFLGCSALEALRWRRVDPHFREPGRPRDPREAPSPAARFPASPEGWADALGYARGKCP